MAIGCSIGAITSITIGAIESPLVPLIVAIGANGANGENPKSLWPFYPWEFKSKELSHSNGLHSFNELLYAIQSFKLFANAFRTLHITYWSNI